MGYIDTHTHIYLSDFKEDLAGTIQRAKDAGLERIYLPNIDSGYIVEMLKLADAYPDFCFPMLALHPGSVSNNYREELEIIQHQFQLRSWYGIGETGVDLYWDTTFKQEQIESFEQHIQWAVDYKLPLVVHSRNSFDLIMEILSPHKGPGLRGVFHCFTGSYEQARKVIDLGFMLGIGGILTYKKSGLDEVVKKTGLGHLVLETDAPYLSPVPHRGKRNEPAYMVHTAQHLANCLGISLEEVKEQTRLNALNLFSGEKNAKL